MKQKSLQTRVRCLKKTHPDARFFVASGQSELTADAMDRRNAASGTVLGCHENIKHKNDKVVVLDA